MGYEREPWTGAGVGMKQSGRGGLGDTRREFLAGQGRADSQTDWGRETGYGVESRAWMVRKGVERREKTGLGCWRQPRQRPPGT